MWLVRRKNAQLVKQSGPLNHWYFDELSKLLNNLVGVRTQLFEHLDVENSDMWNTFSVVLSLLQLAYLGYAYLGYDYLGYAYLGYAYLGYAYLGDLNPTKLLYVIIKMFT